jgi:PASTA domain
MPDVKVPLLGNVPKGGLFAGGLAVAGTAGYLWYKHMKGQQVASAAASVTPPAAGYGYGSAYGYGTPYAYATSPYGYGFGAAGYGIGTYGGFGGGGFPFSPFGYGQQPITVTTNAQWSQNVITALTGQGFTGTAVLASIGKYLAGKPIVAGSSDDTTIQAAIAIEGEPPQANTTTGMPPAINYQGKTGQSGGDVTVPNVVGLDVARAQSILGSAGLSFNQNEPGDRPHMVRIVTAESPKAGSKVAEKTHVNLTWHYQHS